MQISLSNMLIQGCKTETKADITKQQLSFRISFRLRYAV